MTGAITEHSIRNVCHNFLSIVRIACFVNCTKTFIDSDNLQKRPFPIENAVQAGPARVKKKNSAGRQS